MQLQTGFMQWFRRIQRIFIVAVEPFCESRQLSAIYEIDLKK